MLFFTWLVSEISWVQIPLETVYFSFKRKEQIVSSIVSCVCFAMLFPHLSSVYSCTVGWNQMEDAVSSCTV